MDEPHISEEIQSFPIVEAHSIFKNGILVFADFTGISAYGSKGLIWMTNRISSDGLKITEITDNYIKGLAWDSPRQREVEFLVDIETGQHQDRLDHKL